MSRICVLGGGSWGTALALVLSENGHRVSLFARDAGLVADMERLRENAKYLPGLSISERIRPTSSLENAIRDSDAQVLAVPTHAFRETLQAAAAAGFEGRLRIVSVAKGIENNTLLRMEEVAAEVLGAGKHDYVSLSGPTHAEEVARMIPSAIVAASRDAAAAAHVQELFMIPALRVYTLADIVGVEIGGALKNIIALAAGICDGVGFGDNTKAALITRGLAEITRLGVALGAEPMTFAGLSGMGDLIATCMSRHSRNRFVGEEIGKGRTLSEILEGMHMVAEGVRTTRAAYELAAQHRIDMPILRRINAVLFNNESPREAVTSLMTRDPKTERWDG